MRKMTEEERNKALSIIAKVGKDFSLLNIHNNEVDENEGLQEENERLKHENEYLLSRLTTIKAMADHISSETQFIITEHFRKELTLVRTTKNKS